MNAIGLVALTLLVGAGLSMFGEGEGFRVSEPERLATGFQFTEGPLWMPDGYLVFSDIPANTIYALRGEEPEVWRRPSGNSNGLTVDNQGRLVACEHGNRRVSVTEEDGSVVPLATHYEGRRLNSPNDVVVASDGSAYFTDPPYGVQEEQRQLDFQGVYRIGPDDELTLLVDDFVRPNGLAFSPDESVLYVADTDRDWVRAFDVAADGALGNGRVFYKVEEPARLRPDGMKVDSEGNLYIAGWDGVVIVAPDGSHVQTVELPERPANLAFGGPDGRTLFVTARRSVYSFRVRHPGVVVSGRLEGAE
jgi:gluconolactonase